MKVFETSTSTSSHSAGAFGVGNGEIWEPYKNLLEMLSKVINEPTSGKYLQELEGLLKQQKPDFSSLVVYRKRSASARAELQKAASEGINLRSGEGKQLIPQQLINESLIISDMFDINEFLALDLLSTAETEMENHAGWARGLVAIYLYFEGRSALIQSLHTMLLVTPGLSWSTHLPEKVTNVFQKFIDQIFENDMMDKLIGLYDKSSIEQQMELLESNLALGDWRHRYEILSFLRTIRNNIAQIVFCWAAQKNITWKDTLRLLEYLKTRINSRDFTLEKSDVCLLTAVLSCIDSNIKFAAVDIEFVRQLKKYIADEETKIGTSSGFQFPEIVDFIKLYYTVTCCRIMSESHINSLQGGSAFPYESEISREDEDFEFKKDVFAYVKSQVFSTISSFSKEYYVMSKFHGLFVDFITYMPMKLNEMKNRSEDAAKMALLYTEQGIFHPPNLCQQYENFLECLGVFYTHDEDKLGEDFFSLETRNLSLNKLVKCCCVDSPFMFVSNVKMLTGLCCSCPSGVFDLLKQNGHNISFDHFFDSIMKYLASFGGEKQEQMSHGQSVYESETFHRVVMDSMKQSINPAEVLSICSYLDLVEALCRHSEPVKHLFIDSKSQWIKIILSIAKIRAVPREIRVKMLHTAAAMINVDSCSPETKNNMWEIFYSVKLISHGTGDLRDELEEKESRLESYSLTIGLLKLMKSLVNLRFSGLLENLSETPDLSFVLDNGAFDPYVYYVREAVFMKAFHRGYKDDSEKWLVASLSVEIMTGLLDYVHPLMIQLLCDSELLNRCFECFIESVKVRDGTLKENKGAEEFSLKMLNLILQVLQRQDKYLFEKKSAGLRFEKHVVVGMHELLMKIHPESGRPEAILAIIGFIDHLSESQHRSIALEILTLLVSGHSDTDGHLYAALQSDSVAAAVFRQTIVLSLYDVNEEEAFKSNVLLLMRHSMIHSSPNMALFLIGADKKIDFQDPSVGFPRNVLHAILDNIAHLPSAFATLLVFMKDGRIWDPLLRYLRSTQILLRFFEDELSPVQMNDDFVGYLLNCMAIELKTSPVPGSLAHALVGYLSRKLQDVLSQIQFETTNMDPPELEFFDSSLVFQVMKNCEVFDRELGTKLVRTDIFDSLLKEEISKLEGSTALRLRNSVHSEAKELVSFATRLNEIRKREFYKGLIFDGWRQCLEILVLSDSILEIAGMDFVTSMLRVLLIKVANTTTPTEHFRRYSAETTVTLCAVMNTLDDEVNNATLSIILDYVCKWINIESSPKIRAILYACVLYIISKLKKIGSLSTVGGNCFSLIVENLCKDSCQAHEVGRIQAMYLMSEIICITTYRGLGGISTKKSDKSLSMSDSRAFQTANQSFVKDLANSTMKSSGGVFSDGSQASGIMNVMFSKGFLGNLVDSLTIVDDQDLVALFSGHPDHISLKALYVFEAKISLFCRFAATGPRATSALLNANLVHKLSDMKIFLTHVYHKDGAEEMFTYDRPDDKMEQEGDTSVPNLKTIMESLFAGCLKLLHFMVDSSPKSLMLIEQVWNFISKHDKGLSSLLNYSFIQKDKPKLSTHLLASLIAKISRKIPSLAAIRKLQCVQRLQNVLRIQVVSNSISEFRMGIVKSAMLHLYHVSQNSENGLEGVQTLDPLSCQLVLRPAFELGGNYELGSLEDDISVGTVFRLVENACKEILIRGVANFKEEELRTIITTVEVGLTMAYFHTRLFLDKTSSCCEKYRDDAKKFHTDVSSFADGDLAKVVGDVVKVLPEASYLETILFRLKRIVVKC